MTLRSRFARFAISLFCFVNGAVVHAAGKESPSVADTAGQAVYLDFWASWCGPCAESFPWLNQMRERYGDRLTIVGVNVDAQSTDAQRFLQQHPAEFKIVYDPTGSIAGKYRIKGMPSSVILDGEGHVLHQHSGFRDKDRGAYEAAIQQAIGAPPNP